MSRNLRNRPASEFIPARSPIVLQKITYLWDRHYWTFVLPSPRHAIICQLSPTLSDIPYLRHDPEGVSIAYLFACLPFAPEKCKIITINCLSLAARQYAAYLYPMDKNLLCYTFKPAPLSHSAPILWADKLPTIRIHTHWTMQFWTRCFSRFRTRANDWHESGFLTIRRGLL